MPNCLIADDSKVMRMLLCKIMENFGYTVTEADYSSEDYTQKIVFSDDANKKIDSASDTVNITNTKGTTVDTGVVLDSLPYILLIAVAVVGVVAFTAKKRTTDR